ncbi:hypothetical protein K7X08_028890 [Anisodus acutangulus]|uniref:Uncharacterized protein n=1 Tax=Anisodus acutangulus TaxID=402998 RepID=A0A9Q1QSD4_9SOLA|nr:hypothetical protein K7X08_028890 [Anisodus acutangulus]
MHHLFCSVRQALEPPKDDAIMSAISLLYEVRIRGRIIFKKGRMIQYWGAQLLKLLQGIVLEAEPRTSKL